MANYSNKIDKEKEKEEQKAKLQDLVDGLDKNHIARLIEQGVKTKAFGSTEWFESIAFQFTVGLFNYSIVRRPNNLNKEAIKLLNERNKARQFQTTNQQINQQTLLNILNNKKVGS